MKDGFIRVAAAGFKVKVADPAYNAQMVIQKMRECRENRAKVVVFPELAISGYTCGDLFFQEKLIQESQEAVLKIIETSKEDDAVLVVGFPYSYKGKLYDAAAIICGGRLLGIVPKTYLSNKNGLDEPRYFAKAPQKIIETEFGGYPVLFGSKLLFLSDEELVIGCEIGEDMQAAISPGTCHALEGANLIVNPGASNEEVGKREYRRQQILVTSAKLSCGYVYAGAGEGESTQDVVFGGHHLIAENGSILQEAHPFSEETICEEIDIYRVISERRKNLSFILQENEEYCYIPFELHRESLDITRIFPKMPFVPEDAWERQKRCGEILDIQANGLKKRLEHTHCRSAVIGVSGGLDSTLALLVAAKACDLLGWERSRILAVTMPCFGTTNRTYENACLLAKALGASLREVDIKKAVLQHFEDIGQSPDCHDVTYENGQARERTQVLMDMANQCGGMVIGTGDLSELALGWATYNGDHMSMYGVNASVPKTLVRHLVRYYADVCCEETLQFMETKETGGEMAQFLTTIENSSQILSNLKTEAVSKDVPDRGKDALVGSKTLKQILEDILDTPVSPELLPPVNGTIAQKTEDLVGPYELHDFFLYYMMRFGYSPSKIFRMAVSAFRDEYDEETVLKWLKTFYRRFFSQQFKRSCLPDGPKVGSVGVSPRGDLQMPSDASVSIWMDEIENL